MSTPNYFGILPASVRYDKKLSSSQKLLYSELTALTNKQGYCFAKNSYFADLYDVAKETVSRWVSKLEESGYVKVVLIRENKEIIERRIFINQSTPIDNNVNTPIDENIKNPIDENVKDNNTRYNNTRYNKGNQSKSLTKSKVLELFNSSYPKSINRATLEPTIMQFDGNLNELVNGLQRYSKYCKATKPKLQHITDATNFIKYKKYLNGFEYTEDPEEEYINAMPKLKIIRADR